MSDDPRKGPIDEREWVAQLSAHVVDDGPPARVCGYAVDSDLVANYSFVELIHLSVTGELPAPPVTRLIDAALVSLSPFGAGEGPARAAQLAILSSAQESAALVTGTVALIERVRVELDDLAPLLAWLEEGARGLPPACAHDDGHDAGTLLALCRATSQESFLVPGLGRLASALMVLWRAGIRSKPALAYLVTSARLPAVLAEARHALRLGFAGHPINTPGLEFVGDEGPS